MNDAPQILAIPEPVFITMLVVWLAFSALAFCAGYFKGRSDEMRRRAL